MLHRFVGAARKRRELAENANALYHYVVMPEVSRFFGIVITMYYNDHEPPHFHARYGENRAIIAIGTFDVLAGSLPSRVLGLVLEWASLHRDDLVTDWQRARSLEPLEPIEPLE